MSSSIERDRIAIADEITVYAEGLRPLLEKAVGLGLNVLVTADLDVCSVTGGEIGVSVTRQKEY